MAMLSSNSSRTLQAGQQTSKKKKKDISTHPPGRPYGIIIIIIVTTPGPCPIGRPVSYLAADSHRGLVRVLSAPPPPPPLLPLSYVAMAHLCFPLGAGLRLAMTQGTEFSERAFRAAAVDAAWICNHEEGIVIWSIPPSRGWCSLGRFIERGGGEGF
jgi:hypothetical protein